MNSSKFSREPLASAGHALARGSRLNNLMGLKMFAHLSRLGFGAEGSLLLHLSGVSGGR